MSAAASTKANEELASANEDDVILIRRTKDPSKRNARWANEEVILQRKNCEPGAPKKVSLTHGGSIYIVPAILEASESQEVKKEVMKSGHFRAYKIQGGQEPRLHFLLHEDAVESSNTKQEQPGYRYGGTTMQAKPMKPFPKVMALGSRVEAMARSLDDDQSTEGTYWSLGADIVYYRDGNDSISLHKDNDQGEQRVVTVIPYCPIQRKVIIQSDTNLEQYVLLLRTGDAYALDAEMQKNYKHAVPKVKESSDESEKCDRMVIVFRRGTQRNYSKDSGEQSTDLMPPVRDGFRKFGHVAGIEEGYCYGPSDVRLKGHTQLQCGVNGNETQGCVSINVSKPPENDSLLKFDYTAQPSHGGYRLKTSAEFGVPVRVFRSANYPTANPFAPMLSESKKSCYRFDGLYNAHAHDSNKEDAAGDDTFTMVRAEKGRSAFDNRLDDSEFLEKCAVLKTLSESALGALRSHAELPQSQKPTVARTRSSPRRSKRKPAVVKPPMPTSRSKSKKET